MAAASGSEALRHWQFGFEFAGRCIGHCPFAPCTHVQLIESAAWISAAMSDSCAVSRTESWQQSHPHTTHDRRRRNTHMTALAL